MRATALVEMLLEMNVLNPGDFERKVDILAADINDETLAQWFSRTVKYVFQNMDELSKRSYRPVPKEWFNARGIHGTAHPFVSAHPEDLPTGSISKNLLTMLASREGSTWWKREPALSKRVTPQIPVGPTAKRKAEVDAELRELRKAGDHEAADALKRLWNSEVENERNAAEAKLRAAGKLGYEEAPSKEAGITGLGYYDPVAQSDWERWQSQRSEIEKAQSAQFAGIKPHKPRRAKKVVENALFEANPQDLIRSNTFKALKSAVDKKDEPDEVQRALLAFMGEVGVSEDEVNQALASRKPDEKLVQALRTVLQGQVHEVALQTLRGAARQLTAYSTKLHQPAWNKRLGQEYQRFTPKTTGLGLPFTAPKEAPAWMQKSVEQGNSPEAFYFDPLRTHDRAFWQGLENLVSYLNYAAAASAELGTSEVAEDRVDSEKAKELIARLQLGKTADFDLFLDTYTEAQEFSERVPSILHRRSMRLIARYNDLELYELTSPEAIQTFARRPRWTPSDPSKTKKDADFPAWCTAREELHWPQQYYNYAQGVVYGIQKEGKPYIMAAPGPGCNQIMHPENQPITPEQVDEIAPLLAKIPNSKLRYFQRPDIMNAAQSYRRTHGIPDIP